MSVIKTYNKTITKDVIANIKKLKIAQLREKDIKEILKTVKETAIKKIKNGESFNVIGVAGVRVRKEKASTMNAFGKTIKLPERYIVRVKISEALKKSLRK